LDYFNHNIYFFDNSSGILENGRIFTFNNYNNFDSKIYIKENIWIIMNTDKELVITIILILIIFIYMGLVVNRLEKQVNNKIKDNLDFSNLTIMKDIEVSINRANNLLTDEKKRLQEGYYEEGKKLFNDSRI